MYGCESWTVKKAECQTIDAFELWCWKRLLRVPWTPRRSNQSILKEISPGCSLELSIFIVKLSHPYMSTRKTIALTRWNFVGKVISLLFNIQSRLVITFLPSSSVQFSCSVMSKSLRPHALQHVRLPCQSPTPGT